MMNGKCEVTDEYDECEVDGECEMSYEYDEFDVYESIENYDLTEDDLKHLHGEITMKEIDAYEAIRGV